MKTKEKTNNMETKTWSRIKKNNYRKKETEQRDQFDRKFKSFNLILLLRNAREEKNLTQKQIGEVLLKNYR